MILDDYERLSPLWGKLQRYLEERIEVCRKKNDSDLDHFETVRLRGEIQAYKRLLAIGEHRPPIETDTADSPA